VIGDRLIYSKASKKKVFTVAAGSGVICSVVVSSQDEPSPLGENIFFCESSVCETLAKQRVMKEKFLHSVETSENVIAELESIVKRRIEKKLGLVPAKEVEISSAGILNSKDESLISILPEDNREASKMPIILKCSNDLMIGTIIDALNENSGSDIPVVELILADTGPVSVKDVELAKDSKATILTFGTKNCTPEVLKEAKV
jgi:hypothetical protein